MQNTLDTASIILEACVETLEQCITAEQKGAGRVELCDRLDLDGTTPSEDLIRAVKKALKIPIRVMIRPRGGDFIYTPAELDQMRQSILLCQDIGVDGVVLGILNKDNELDLEAMRPLIELAKPLNVVIHKAIDDTPDTFAPCSNCSP
ncbi:copper homeostasis protein CutC [Geofilum rubicundum]|uniref:Copper homeostasis protein cutC homolog n=1 Tax=Geofilum rubicundum JCM 15548 TaxID=1236989 RepID=A0A0E9LXG4_9BACT|nr:copper homeostasis protein CutC [Geofilum rubicundum]GAO29836.1 cytoplasmic copper homeostasis protein cutC [Geofilum rubicundum JCM 15548]